jgi:hypothetical protein
VWSHRTLGAFALLLLASCDRVLGLERPSDAGDAGGEPVDACVATNSHDEDGDGTFDSCDACPGVKHMPPVADLDLDTVPDACDPRPLEGGDFLAHFVTFAEPNAATRWMAMGWSVGNDALRFIDPIDQYQDTLDKVMTEPFPRPYSVVASLVIDRVPTTAGQIAVLATDNYLVCGLKHSPANSVVFVYRDTNPGGSAETPLPMALVPGLRLVLEVVYDPANNTAICRATTDTTTRVAMITNITVPPTGPIGFEGKNLDATFEYAAIYRWQP